MKFSILPFALLSALTSAQSATPTTTSFAPAESCLAKCSGTDLDCKASCLGVPHPNPSQIGATNTCASNCNQGNGSKSDTEKYASCLQGCFSSIFTATGVAAAVTTAASSGVSGAAGATTVTVTITRSVTTAASHSGNAADRNQLSASAAGLLGFLMYALAL